MGVSSTAMTTSRAAAICVVGGTEITAWDLSTRQQAPGMSTVLSPGWALRFAAVLRLPRTHAHAEAHVIVDYGRAALLL